MKCPKCGVETGDPSALCPVCGSYFVLRPSVAADEAADALGNQRDGGRNSRRDLRAALSLGLALLVLIIGIIAGKLVSPSHHSPSHRPSSRQLTYTQLRPGDCLQGADLSLGTDSAWPTVVTAVPCTHEHLAEIFFSGNAWSRSRAYLGSNAIRNKSYARCLRAFQAYDGIAQSESAFEIADSAPNAPAWSAGDRLLICVAYEPNPNASSGAFPVHISIKGSHQ